MLAKEQKTEIIKKFGNTPKDTGSAAVQIALVTERINQLTLHLQSHLKDHHSRRGLLKMVGMRRNLMNYLKGENEGKYKEILETLKLRK